MANEVDGPTASREASHVTIVRAVRTHRRDFTRRERSPGVATDPTAHEAAATARTWAEWDKVPSLCPWTPAGPQGRRSCAVDEAFKAVEPARGAAETRERRDQKGARAAAEAEKTSA